MLLSTPSLFRCENGPNFVYSHIYRVDVSIMRRFILPSNTYMGAHSYSIHFGRL